MKQLIFMLMLGVCSLSGMVIFNILHPPVSSKFVSDKCTRYCHNVRCEHFESSKQERTFLQKLESYYTANIKWLQHNPWDMGYQSVNLLIYVLCIPSLLFVLLWGILRKKCDFRIRFSVKKG